MKVQADPETGSVDEVEGGKNDVSSIISREMGKKKDPKQWKIKLQKINTMC